MSKNHLEFVRIDRGDTALISLLVLTDNCTFKDVRGDLTDVTDVRDVRVIINVMVLCNDYMISFIVGCM